MAGIKEKRGNFVGFLRTVGLILLVIAIIIIVYQILRAIFGGTWEPENIILSILGIIAIAIVTLFGILINQSNKLGKMEGRMGGLSEDMKRIKDKLNKIS